MDAREKAVPGAYIEIINVYSVATIPLTARDLLEIGSFTRENILAWMGRQRTPDWAEVLPATDFHAVCGDIDIPWAHEGSKVEWDTIRERAKTKAAANAATAFEIAKQLDLKPPVVQ